MVQRIIVSMAFIAIAILGSPQSTFAEAADKSAQKTILVTGASSGIGRIIAETLAADGYFVYAGARKQADLDALNEVPNIQSVRLDVTKQDEIDADQAYSDSDEELIEMLKEATAAQRK